MRKTKLVTTILTLKKTFKLKQFYTSFTNYLIYLPKICSFLIE